MIKSFLLRSWSCEEFLQFVLEALVCSFEEVNLFLMNLLVVLLLFLVGSLDIINLPVKLLDLLLEIGSIGLELLYLILHFTLFGCI
jgi:hypothetical protein